MSKMPECRSMNFSVYDGMLKRYKDSEDIKNAYEKSVRTRKGTGLYTFFEVISDKLQHFRNVNAP